MLDGFTAAKQEKLYPSEALHSAESYFAEGALAWFEATSEKAALKNGMVTRDAIL